MRFQNLTWPDIDRLLEDERETVLLFPVGATEPHGPHGPLHTDVIISMGICERVVKKLEEDSELRAVILPPLSFGVTRCASSFPGAIHISEGALHHVLVDACTSLIEQGFRHIMLINNHFEPAHVATLHRAIETVRDQTGTPMGYMDLTRKERAAQLTEEFRKAECHAGRYETSLVLADHPNLVKQDVMRELPYVPVNLAEVMSEGKLEFKEMGLEQAYCGSPAKASAEEGEQSYQILAEMLIELMRELVRGKGGRDEPGLYTRI